LRLIGIAEPLLMQTFEAAYIYLVKQDNEQNNSENVNIVNINNGKQQNAQYHNITAGQYFHQWYHQTLSIENNGMKVVGFLCLWSNVSISTLQWQNAEISRVQVKETDTSRA
jgi:hypothetical protein